MKGECDLCPDGHECYYDGMWGGVLCDECGYRAPCGQGTDHESKRADSISKHNALMRSVRIGREDKERLDWMTANGAQLLCFVGYWWVLTGNPNHTPYGLTPRAAIDAAKEKT